MTIDSVAPALFRVRAFEQDWSALLRRIATLERQYPFRYGGLNAVLAAEARRWLRLGTEIGYFGGADDLMLPEGHEGQGYFEEVHIDEASFFPGDPPELTPFEFADQVNLSREDLTLPRVEFLFLLMFSSGTDWEKRLTELSDFAEELERQPLSRNPASTLNRVAWGLSGAESETGERGCPAMWRLGDFEICFLGEDPLRTKQRLTDLSSIRARVLALLEKVAEAEAILDEEREGSVRRADVSWWIDREERL
jgi:hypothetical protein